MDQSNGRPTFICKNCRNPIALKENILSKKFKGKSGPAYLFSQAMNVVLGSKEERQLITGTYMVADVSCNKCNQVLGWKYIYVQDPTQKYKEGRFVLEIARFLKEYKGL